MEILWKGAVSPETMRKLCLSTKFPHHEIRWNYGILRSFRNCKRSFSKKLPICITVPLKLLNARMFYVTGSCTNICCIALTFDYVQDRHAIFLKFWDIFFTSLTKLMFEVKTSVCFTIKEIQFYIVISWYWLWLSKFKGAL